MPVDFTLFGVRVFGTEDVKVLNLETIQSEDDWKSRVLAGMTFSKPNEPGSHELYKPLMWEMEKMQQDIVEIKEKLGHIDAIKKRLDRGGL